MLEEIKSLVVEQGDAIVKFRDDCLSAIAAERKEREELEARINRQGLTASGWKGERSAEPELKALGAFARSGDDSEIKTMSVGSDPDGGYTVLPVLSERMTTRLYDISPMRKVSRVEVISAGDAFEEIDDRDESDAVWVGEHTSRPATDTPKIGKWVVPVHEIYALQPITQRLLDDSSRDMGVWIEQKISDKFARSEGTAFVSGDGHLKPKGFLTYDAVEDGDFTRERGKLQYVKTGKAASFPDSNPADVLKKLMWSLRTPYRNGACWMMNSSTAQAIDKLKNGGGDYIWRDGMTVGAPPSLLGYPVEINEDMPDIGANAFPIAFGNFQLGYCIVEKVGIKYLRDPYTDKPNVLFYAYRRVGGGVANDDAIKLLKCEA